MHNNENGGIFIQRKMMEYIIRKLESRIIKSCNELKQLLEFCLVANLTILQRNVQSKLSGITAENLRERSGKPEGKGK